MPDYLNILTQQQEETDNAIKQKQGGVMDVQDPMGTVPEGQPQQPQQPQEPQMTPEEQDNQDALDLFRQLKHPMSSQMDRNIPENPYTWTPEFTQRGFVEEVGTSLARGFGKYVVGGTGDIIQLVNGVIPGWEIREGNMLSRALQEKGKEFEDEFQVFLPEELKDPKFSLNTFMNPEFWSKVGAEYIPQLAEMVLISRGVGGALKGATRSAVKGIGETMTKESLEAIGKKAVVNTYGRAIGGQAKAAKEVAAQGLKDWRGLFITSTGEATQGLLTATETFGGGLSMNLIAGLQNAGSLMNEMKVLKDPETGEPLYTEEQLGQMAANTMTENMKYLPIDMISYGMVYAKTNGKFNKLLNPFNKAQGKKFFSASEQVVAQSKAFTQDIKPVMSFMDKLGNRLGKYAERGRKVGSAAAKPIFEGYEETFQETFEDWAVKKAKARVTGEPITIDGKESGDGASDYFSFYFSKENEATRTVAFALGLLGGAGSNIVEAVNKKAEIAAKNYYRTELMKHGATNEAGAERLNEFIKQDIVDYIIDGGVNIKAVLDNLLDNEIIDQEGHKDFVEIAKTLEEAYEKAQNLGSLNVAGKIAFLENKLKAKVAEMGMAYQEDKTNKRIATLKEEYKNDPVKMKQEIRDAENALETIRTALTKQMAEGNQGVLNILNGEKADVSNVRYADDGKGNSVAVGLSEEDYNNWYNKTDKEIYDAAREKAVDPRPALSKMGNTLKEFYKSAAEKLGKFKDQSVQKANDYLDNRKMKKTKELSEEAEIEPLKSVNDLSGEITIGDETINFDESVEQLMKDKDESGNVISEEEAKNILLKEVNQKIKDHNKSIKDAKTEYGKFKATQDQKGGRMYKANEDLNEDEIVTEEDILEAAKLNVEPKRQATNIDQYIEKTFDTKSENNISQAEAEMEDQIKKAKIDFTDEAQAKVAIEKLIDEGLDRIGDVMLAGTDEGMKKQDFIDYLFKLGKEGAFTKETKEQKAERQEKLKKKTEKIKKAKEAEKERPDRKNFEIAQQARKYNNPNWNEEYKRIVKNDPSQAEVLQKEYDEYLSSTIARATMEPSVIMQQITVNQHLRRLFPNTGIQVYAMDNLYNALKDKEYDLWEEARDNGPARALGYAIGSAIMIDEKVWHQDQIFMHEFAHIHYSLTKNEPATVAIVKEALKDKEKVAYIKSKYADQIIYEYKQKGWKPGMQRARAMKSQLDDKELARLDRQLYGRYRADGKTRDKRTITAKEMPIEYQEVILDEIFADYIQGPLAKTYNKYFRPQNEFTRQQKVKNWWKWLKNKALANEEEYVDVLKTLEEGNTVPAENLRNHIMKNFVDSVKGKDVTMKGRFSKYDDKAKLIANENAMIAIDYARETQQTLTQEQIDFENEMMNSINDMDVSKIGTIVDDYDYFAEHEEVGGDDLYDIDDDFKSLVENSSEMDLGTLWDAGFDVTNLKNNKMVRYFIVQFNKKANERRSKRLAQLKAAGKETDDEIKQGLLTDSRGEMVDATFYEGININNFTQRLEDLAKSYESYIDFIRVLRNSEIPEQKEFMKHIKKEYKDNMQRLRTMHLLYANSQVLSSIIHYTDKDGNYRTHIPSASQDPQIVKRVLEKIKKASAKEQQDVRFAIKVIKGANADYLSRETGRIALANAIDTFVKFYGHDQILSNKIVQEGYIIVNKENKTLLKGLQFLIEENNLGEVLSDRSENIIKAILNTSKLYDSTSVVVGPNKTNLTTRMFSNHAIKLFNKMVVALKSSENNDTDKAKFLKDFSNGKGEERINPLLENMWNNFHETGQLPLMAIDFGSQNDMYKKSKNYKDASAEQQLVNELLQFQDAIILNEQKQTAANDVVINSYNELFKKGGMTEKQHKDAVAIRKAQLKNLTTNNYYASMDIFGNSNRRILMSIPRIDIINSKGEYKVSQKAKHLKKAWDIYQKMTFDKTADIKNEPQPYAADYNQFEKGIDRGVEKWSDYLLKHSDQFKKIKTLSKIYDTSKTGEVTLNDAGQAMVKNFVFNRVVNTWYMHEIMSPGVQLKGLTKNHKQQIAPVIAIDPNLKVEGIPMADEFNIPEPIRGEENPNETKAEFKRRHDLWKYNRIITNDGMQYILDIHAAEIKASMPELGDGYKLYSASINKENPFFMNQMGQMKGYTTVLTEAEVFGKKDPKTGEFIPGNQAHLKPIYNLLMDRYNKFKADYLARYEVEYDPKYRNQTSTDEKREKYIPIIIPVSADKTSLFKIKELEHLQQRYTLEQLKDSAMYKEYSDLLDKIYYPSTNGYTGNFIGLDGSNFGPQQIMDKNYTRATLSVQAITGIPFAQTKGDNYTRAIKIQNHISQQKWNNLKVQVFDKLKKKGIDDDYGYSNFIMETANKLDSDPYTIRALFSGEMPYSPHLAEFALNQFRAQVIRHGNNIAVPGTLGQTISDMGYRFSKEETINGKSEISEVFINKPGRQNVYPRIQTEQYINGTSALNFYWSEMVEVLDDKGNPVLDKDGKPTMASRTRPMEMILPRNQKFKGVISRQSFYGNKNGIEDAMAYLTKKKKGRYEQLSTLRRLKLVNQNDEIIPGAIEKMLEKNKIFSDKQSKNQIGVYIPGENIVTTRIPNNGPAFIGIGEVVGFHSTDASNIIAPKEYTRIIGADFDGDALFVYRQGKDKDGLVDTRKGDTKDTAGYGHWNAAFDLILEQWSLPSMRHILETPLNFEDGVNAEIKKLGRKLNPEKYAKLDANDKLFNENKITESEFIANETKIKSEGEFIMPFTPEHYIEQYNNSVIAKQTVGIAFNLHRAINMVSIYDTQLSNGMTVTVDGELIPKLTAISINGKRYNRFHDLINQEKSRENTRIQQSTILANIVLDSTKNGHADALNLNKNSIASAMLLINLGFTIQDIGLLLNHPVAKRYIEARNNIGNDYIDDGGYAKMLHNFQEEYKQKNLKLDIYGYPSEFSVDVNPYTERGSKNPNYNSDENNMEIIRLMHYLSKMADDFSTITDITSGHNKIENNPFALEKQINDLYFLMDNKKRDNFNGRNTSTLYFRKQGVLTKAIENTKGQVLYIPKDTKVDVLNTFMRPDDNGELVEMHRIMFKTPEMKRAEQMNVLASDVKVEKHISQNPEIKHYMKVAREYAKHQKRLNIVYNDSVRNIFEQIKSRITGEELTGRQLIHYTEKILPFIYARLIGFNEIEIAEVNEIFKKSSPDGNIPLVDALDRYAEELDKIVYYRDPNNALKKDTEFTRSLIYNQGLQYNNNRIKLNPQVLQQHFTDENAADLKRDFATLPLKLQRQLVLYDLIKNGWSGEESLYPLFSYDITKFITDKAIEFQRDLASDKKFSEKIGKKAFEVIQDLETINKDNNYLPKIYLENSKDKSFEQQLREKLQENRYVLARVLGYEPFRVTAIYQSTTGQSSQVYEVQPLGDFLNQEQKNMLREAEQENIAGNRQLSRARKTNNYRDIAKGIVTEFLDKPGFQLYKTAKHSNLQPIADISEDIPNVHMIMVKVKDDVTTDPNLTKKEGETIPHILVPEMIAEDEAKRKKKSSTTTVGRFFRTDYNNFTRYEKLSKQELLNAYEFKQSLNKTQENIIYNKYLADKRRANEDLKNWVGPDGFLLDKDWTEEELIAGYEKYGAMDAYASANIMVPIMLELIQRESNYQSYEITKRLEGTSDISPMKAWFQSNNIDSSHPATQAIQREIETEYKYFINERKRYMQKIDKVTEDLYAEKLGYSPVTNSFLKRLQVASKLLFRNRDKIYQTLYGNIVKVDSRINDKQQEKRFQLLSKDELKQKLKAKEITQAEYNFAETFREISNDLMPTKDYYTGIPQSGPGIMEAFARKGLLGVLVSSRPIDQAIYDVYMNYEGQRMTFKQIEDIYRQDLKSNWKNNIDYIKLRNKARKLYKEGKNEDGSRFYHGRVFNHTILSDGMVNNFANGGWVNANDFLSMDLNKALTDFTHAQLFMEGNENFIGFKTMQAKVDGLLLHNQMKGFNNQNQFVRKVYKEYFLKGHKLNKTTSGDKVMDAMIRGNLLYIMGWKMLAVGKGLYTIGNVVVGKYNNIKNQGGKTWARGEARYWGINQNGSKHRKAMGVLKTLNFMNISLYDDVSMSKSSGLDRIFTDIALAPMLVTENWIQGAHFLGMLSEDQWNLFDDNGEYKEGATQILPEELIVIENAVKNSHGKGYTPVDQRLIQRYSWGRAIMQFSRFIPTMFYDKFSKEDINIYGEKHIGSLRAVWEPIAKVMGGEMTYEQFKNYRNHLKETDPAKLARLDAGLKGLAMVSVAIIAGKTFNIGVANELVGDANYLVNQEKLEYKLFPSVARTIIDMASVFTPS